MPRSKSEGDGGTGDDLTDGGGGTTRRAASRRHKPAQANSRAARVFPVVGVGASAGGLEALSEFLGHLATDTGMAFVIIQHLAPDHSSILPEILSRHTIMPVSLAENEMELEPDHVYVIPPGQDMAVFHGRLNLTERTKAAGMHLPIDHFLRSLALDQHSRAIGVVLSGSASDGALGLTAVKAEGGITFAQDPSSARYDGMPVSAIRANAVDKVADPAGIARELAHLGKHPYVLSKGEDEPIVAPEAAETEGDWMNRIFLLLRSVFDVDFSSYRMNTIHRRIQRRMALHRMDSLEDYVDYLSKRPSEIEDLYHDILIMVTEFFREPEAFAALLDTVLPGIIGKKQGDEEIRVWVPGCSTGEEPYSIALLLTRGLRQAGRELPVKIFATDISERDIEQARTGVFAENKYATVPEEYRHFFSSVDGGLQINKSIRDEVVFARHDVTSDPPFSQLDLVSCRNLLIYLGPEAQERVLPIIHYSLRPRGYLLLGASESIGSATDLFAPVDKKNKIYVKKPTTAKRLPTSLAYSTPFVHERRSHPGDGAHGELLIAERRFDPQRAAEDVLLTRFVPPSVVVTNEYQIIQFRGGIDEFLKHSSGRASLSVLDMAREGLAAEIRKVVEKARTEDGAVSREGVRYHVGREVREVGLEVVPIRGPAEERYFLILFRPSDSRQLEQGRRDDDRGDTPAMEQDETVVLQRELHATREYMRDLVQDKEAALEELRAANEEIQSSNEELQSINEELETAKEELQSTNEELRTVNEELEHRNAQLSTANDDLSNLLRAVDVPTIIVDRDLQVRRFTPGAERVMNLIDSDLGRPVTDIALRLELPDLADLLIRVIEDISVAEREVRDDQGHWFSLRIRPYQTEENRIEGAVLTLVDVDELRRSLADFKQAAELSEGMKRVLSALQHGHSRDEVMSGVLAQGTASVEAKAALVLLRKDEAWVVTHAHGAGRDAHGATLSPTEAAQATIAETTGGPVTVQSAGGSPIRLPLGFTASSFVGVPLISEGRFRGVLLFAWQETPPPDKVQVDFVSKVGAIVSLALAED